MSTPLASLASGKTAINGGAVDTTGTQTYGDDVTLGLDTTISASTATFSGKVTGSTNSLTITGNAVLGDGSGDDTLSAASLSISGTTNINTAAITGGDQTYTGAVTLGHDATLTAATATFHGTLAGGERISRSRRTVLGNDPTDTVNNLATLTVSGTTTINTATVTTSGTQTYSDAVSIRPIGAYRFDCFLHWHGQQQHDQEPVDYGAVVFGNAQRRHRNRPVEPVGERASTINTTTITSAGQTYSGTVTLRAPARRRLLRPALAICCSHRPSMAALSTSTGGSTTFSAAVGGGTALSNLSITTAALSASDIKTATGVAVTDGAARHRCAA